MFNWLVEKCSLNSHVGVGWCIPGSPLLALLLIRISRRRRVYLQLQFTWDSPNSCRICLRTWKSSYMATRMRRNPEWACSAVSRRPDEAGQHGHGTRDVGMTSDCNDVASSPNADTSQNPAPTSLATSRMTSSNNATSPINVRDQFMAFFQVSDNKLSMKLFGNRKALLRERQRQKAVGNWVVHPCSNFRWAPRLETTLPSGPRWVNIEMFYWLKSRQRQQDNIIKTRDKQRKRWSKLFSAKKSIQTNTIFEMFLQS